MAKRILILGSCVSRDILNYDKNKSLELVNYYARSSLASLISKPCVNQEILGAIDSKFQRRMVENDMKKSFWTEVKIKSFDVLLLDFIDERFHLVCNADGSFCTYSSEYKQAIQNLGIPTPKLLNQYGKKKFELWCKGFAKLITILKESNKLEKLYINKVFWVNNLKTISDEVLQNANEFLNKMYQKASEYIAANHLITYPQELLWSDPRHVWGGGAFHYNEKLYEYGLEKIVGIQE